MSTTMTGKSTRNPWPGGIIAAFALFASGLVVFVGFASRQSMDLVRKDYYEAELRYQEQLDRMTRTRLAGCEPVLEYDAQRHCLALAFPALPPGQPVEGMIHLYRPSDARLDREIKLVLDDAGAQRIDTRGLRAGLWKVHVSWHVNGTEFYAVRTVILAKDAS